MSLENNQQSVHLHANLMSFTYQHPQSACKPFLVQSIDTINHEQLSNVASRSDHYELVWMKSGTACVELNLTTHVLQPGSIVCFAPGQLRRFEFDPFVNAVYFKLDAAFFYCMCMEAKFPLININSHHLSRPAIIRVKVDSAPDLANIVANIQKQFLAEDDASIDLVCVWLKLFLMYIRQSIAKSECSNINTRDMDLVMQFMKLLSKNFTGKKMVTDYADSLNVSPNYLNQIVKRVSGFSASHHIHQYLVLEAKRLVVHSSKSMKEIAYLLGFDDLAHFSKFFKNNSGTNFSNFRKTLMASQF